MSEIIQVGDFVHNSVTGASFRYEIGMDRTSLIRLGSAADLVPPSEEGTKHDGAKPDLTLLPKIFLDQTAQAFMYGEKKYGRHNYKKGMAWHRPAAAALRHITAWVDNENIDSESGLLHLAHASACLAMLMFYIENNKGTDTREEK